MHTTKIDGTSRLKSGMELVLTKWIALGGTAAIAADKEEELQKKFPEDLIRTAKTFQTLGDTEAEKALAETFGECQCLPLGEGGILSALWKIADEAGLGLTADLRKIPIRQETVEITEVYDVNPYGLFSAGALLIGTFQGLALTDALKRQGIHAAVIGTVTEGPDRVIYNQEIKRYVDKPARDEIYKVLPCWGKV